MEIALEGLEPPHVDARLPVAVPGLLPVCQRAGKPSQGVGAGDDQRAHQQRGHSPERIEQEGGLLRVVVRRVREVSGELPVRPRVALAARGHNVVPAQARSRVVDRQDIVRTVTVVAFRGLQVTQLGDLPVERLEVGVRDLLVAASALVHNVQTEIGEIGALDAVGRMAIGANGQLLAGFVHVRAVDAGGEHLVDAAVAFRACLGDIVAVHAGARVAGGQFAMRRVAVGTIRGHSQAALQKAFAVNAFLVVLHDLILLAGVPQRRFFPRLMALGAQRRHVAGERRRRRIGFAEGGMLAVAGLAGRRVRAPLGRQLAVRAFLILAHLVGVADGAVHLLWHGVAGPQVRRRAARVALDAGLLGVPRSFQFGLVHEEGNGFAGARDLQVGVGMAVLAVAVRHPLRVINLPYLVRLVAVHAGRNHVWFLLPELAPDHLPVYGFDLPVTLLAGGGDIGFGDGRAWIGVRQNEMCRMAARANRRDGKTFLVKGLAMEAILVVLQDVGLGYVVRQADRRAFAMATAAELRYFHRRGGRTGVRWLKNVVGSMAALASRRKLVATSRGLPV